MDVIYGGWTWLIEVAWGVIERSLSGSRVKVNFFGFYGFYHCKLSSVELWGQFCIWWCISQREISIEFILSRRGVMSDIFEETTTQLHKRGRIKTSSRLRAIWLCKARGFTVERRLRTPIGYSFGKLTYITVWILKPRSND